MGQWQLEFESVDYTYPGSDRPALQALTLRLPTSKRSALIGQNGCGKTTLFQLANGLYRPQRGKIYYQGVPVRYDGRSLMQLRQAVGLVFQNPEQQVVAATVEQDISYGLCNLGLPEPLIAERVEQILIQFNLLDLATTPVQHLSLGQKKRVSLADVMVLQPQLLLLDEPTAYLDHGHTRQFMALLQSIHAAGTTILLATHDLDLVYRWADWVFVMDQGRLVLEGTPQTVFAQQSQLTELRLEVPLVAEVLSTLKQFQSPNPADGQVSIQQLRERIVNTFF
ncbi:MAG: ABC transporter ATP-binding protein [Cyanobacteria bacterium RM1_2_2]|nr:ABC transporter ATP-binding protein [Cyanobacteria bacterium RM1_2_2]